MPHPTAPPARDRTVDELEDFGVVWIRGIQPIGDQWYNGTWLPWYNQTAANPRKSRRKCCRVQEIVKVITYHRVGDMSNRK